MSFDLYCKPNGGAPPIPELKAYFEALPLFSVNDTSDGGVQFWYRNEVTGVYCSLSYSPLDADEVEGCGSSGLAFNLNYLRPSFFAYETMPLVEAFCKHFDLLVEDPQEETTQPADAERLIASWRAHNTNAVRGMAAAEPDFELNYYPETRATEWWHYMTARQSIEDALTEDLFVPSIMFLQSPRKQLFTMIVWPDGIPQFFPRCDYVYVERQKKRLFGPKEETGVAPYQSVLDNFGSLLDDYRNGELQLKYLPIDKKPMAASLLQSLPLQTIDLGQHTRIEPDNFHDVEFKR